MSWAGGEKGMGKAAGRILLETRRDETRWMAWMLRVEDGGVCEE